MTTLADIEAAADRLAAAEQAVAAARSARDDTIRAARDAGLRPGAIADAAMVSRQTYSKIVAS